jgi:two-component system response regulator WspF
MRIAIVNDVIMAIEAVRRVIASAGQDQLAWIALDGAEAVERCAADTPDLILMDLIMPKMDGVEATRRIMANSPCAIVVVTANVGENSSKVFEAMGVGALDAVNTPVLEAAEGGDGSNALLAKIETIRRLIGGGLAKKSPRSQQPPVRALRQQQNWLIAIGASAGGPSALATVLGQLPADFPAPIVIVQHVDAQFAEGLANWLAHQTRFQVRIAQAGDQPEPGTVLLAGKDHHLIFSSPTKLAYSRSPADCSYRPSIDVFFNSAENSWRGDIVGVLLTGMGNDGAEGLRSLRMKGHHTIAQDRATSAVYGMPKAAAELEAASEILPLERIGPRLSDLVAQKANVNG